MKRKSCKYNKETGTKKCSHCQIDRSPECFSPYNGSSDGLKCVCKQCRNKERRIQYAVDPEYRKSRRASEKKYFDKNKVRVRAARLLGYHRNKERYGERSRMFARKRYQDNPEKASVRARRSREKIKDTPRYRLNNAIRAGVYDSLKDNGVSKGGRRWECITGFTVGQLRIHLENRFLDGMNWNNYGKWHIDHIIPISFFRYNSANDTEFRMCWRLENLQPLWAEDNMIKSNKVA